MPFSSNGMYADAAANIPIVSTGRWHVDGQGSGAQGPTIVVNRAHAVPMWPGRACTLTDVALNIGAAFTTPGTIRAGCYSSDAATGLPAALLGDFGTVVESAITKSWTGLTLTLAPVLYWFVITAQGGSGGTPTWSSRNISHPLVTESNGSAPNPNTNRTAHYSDTGFSGAYPSTFGALAGIIVGPSLAYKLT